jgi:hypothetical protein
MILKVSLILNFNQVEELVNLANLKSLEVGYFYSQTYLFNLVNFPLLAALPRAGSPREKGNFISSFLNPTLVYQGSIVTLASSKIYSSKIYYCEKS